MSETPAEAINTTEATDAQVLQADQAINQDPQIDDAPAASGSVYDDEEAWPYRKLQAEAKDRGLDASGKREELVARLVEDDGAANSFGGVDPSSGVENGGIARSTEFSSTHADSLQSLSDARRAAQLKAVQV